MDYEKAYNKALEMAKSAIKDCGDNKGRISMIESIFPELKESEDERIRKALVNYFKTKPTDFYISCGLSCKDTISWLEKQKSVDEIVERCKNSWYNEGKIAGMAEGLTDDEKYQQGWHDALEKQGKKKPTEWSEDDERIVTALMEGFRYHQLFNPRFGEVPNAEIIDWIKSLKERLI